MKLKNIILAGSLLTLSTASFATAPTALVTTNNSPYWIASVVSGICSTALPNQIGVTPPGARGKSAPWIDVTLLCKTGNICNATVYAFTSAPAFGPSCPGGTPIANAGLNLTDGSIAYTQVASNWSIPSVAGADTSGNVNTTLTYTS